MKSNKKYKKEKELVKTLKAEKYQVIFENANDAIFFHELSAEGLPGNFLAVNREARERLGYSLEEFLSMSPGDIDSGDKKIDVSRVMKELHNKGFSLFEMVHQAKDGTKIPVEISSKLIIVDGEKRVVSVVRNISRIKKAEKMLEKSEHKYRMIFELSPEANVLLNRNGDVIDVNGRMEEWLGYNQDQIIGKNFTELPFLSVMSKKKVGKMFYQRMNGETVQPYELDFITSTGQKKIGLVRAKIVGDKISGEAYDLVMISDITTSKEAERELHKSVEQNRLAVKILHKIGANLELEEIFKILIEELMYELNCSACAILSLQGDGTYKVKAESGFVEKFGMTVFSTDAPTIAYIVNSKKSVHSNDVRKDSLSGCIPPESKMISLICIPILVNKKVKCILHLDSEEKDAFSREDLDFVEFLAGLISFAVERANLFERFKELSIKDGLTNSLNRRKFNMDIVNEIKRAKRYHRDLSLLMIDIDWFKKYNDFHGHTSGDSVLRELVRLIKKESRETDRLYRYGGEEFIIILPETGKLEAVGLANRLREEVQKKIFAGEELSQPKTALTISIGVSSFPDDGEGIKQLIDAADKALYTAKEKGRNQVCAA